MAGETVKYKIMKETHSEEGSSWVEYEVFDSMAVDPTMANEAATARVNELQSQNSDCCFSAGAITA